MRLGVVDLLVARFEVPNTPRRDDLHVGRERLDRQLETDLIVALARAAVADRVRTLFERDLDDLLGDDGARKAGAEQVLALIDRARFERREDIVVDELVGEIGDVQLARARLDRLLFKTLELLALTDVARDRDDLAAVVILFEPRDDYGRVQTARISQNHFLYLVCHKTPLKVDIGLIIHGLVYLYKIYRIFRINIHTPPPFKEGRGLRVPNVLYVRRLARVADGICCAATAYPSASLLRKIFNAFASFEHGRRSGQALSARLAIVTSGKSNAEVALYFPYSLASDGAAVGSG